MYIYIFCYCYLGGGPLREKLPEGCRRLIGLELGLVYTFIYGQETLLLLIDFKIFGSIYSVYVPGVSVATQ